MPFGAGQDLPWLAQEIADRTAFLNVGETAYFHGSVERCNNLVASTKAPNTPVRAGPFNMNVKVQS